METINNTTTVMNNINNANKGFVYILTNPSFKGDIVKIGMTSLTVEERIASLDSTGVVTPFECYASMETERYREVEQLMHAAFEDYRIRSNREFFKIVPERALSVLKKVARICDGTIHMGYEVASKTTCVKDASAKESHTYCLCGVEYNSMAKCFNDFVKKLIADHPEYTFESLYEMLQQSFPTTSSGNKRIISKKEFIDANNADLYKRFSTNLPIVLGGVEFFTNRQWAADSESANFFTLSRFAESLGYEITLK